jgi:hypothetical protein
MKKAMTLILRWTGLAVGVAFAMWVISLASPRGLASYIIGMALFPGAIAWFGYKRSRNKRGLPALPSLETSLISIAIWAVSAIAIAAGHLVIGSISSNGATQQRPENWLLVLGGLCAYWFADWCGSLIDRRAASKVAICS